MRRYPTFDPQPYTGSLLTMQEAGTSDTLYSSGTAPFYQNKIDQRYGRQLAGADQDGTMDDKDNAWASNELEVLAELDDVQGSGIFDPAGTHPNIWPDAGVFAARYSLPGYSARERMFEKSEVRDATTGRPIVPVPSGAVAIDNAAIIALMERGRFRAPEQIIRANDEYPVRFKSIVNVAVNPLPLGGPLGEEPPPPPGEAVTAPGSNTSKFLVAAILVGAAGATIYAMTRKKHRANRRRR